MLRQTLRLFFLLALSCGVLLLATSQHNAASAAPNTGRPEQVVLLPGSPDSPGLQSNDLYLSPVTEAAQPFTHLMLRWEASTPVSSTLALEVRASTDGNSWSRWGEVLEDPDLWMDRDGQEAYWSQVIFAGNDARFWQVRARMQPGPDGAFPSLRQVDVNTVDARFSATGPATEDKDSGGMGLAAVGKPPVVSRTGWGCPDGQESRVRPAYYPVRHMVVHHTADSNSLIDGQNWGDRVRAIWSFHTFTRGWGDVGYNYLVDPNGTIYEGRAGGDDAVGFHDAANYGSMGVSMIGTYANVAPTGAAQESLVNLLAWKASQKGIDPLGSSYYYGCDISSLCPAPNAVAMNISGHRDVTRGTTCPGQALHNILPDIRNRVLTRMGGTPPPPAPSLARLDLVNVRYDRTTLAVGELLKVTFTVKNNDSRPLQTQGPQADQRPNGSFDQENGYTFDEGECFLGSPLWVYPTFPKEDRRLRVMLGTQNWSGSCNGGVGNATVGNYPWRWGLNGTLQPGEQRDVVGYVRFRNPGSVTVQAGAIDEGWNYIESRQFAQTITVLPERTAPVLSEFNYDFRPVARVYQLGDMPDNFLARTRNPMSIPRGTLLGSFPWDGSTLEWREGGPFGSASDNFLIEQTRVFNAPVAGNYTFTTTTDDGSWLWVNGQEVVANHGLHAARVVSGTVYLEAGTHVLSFKYFERNGWATAGYAMQLPGSTTPVAPPPPQGDNQAQAPQRGPTFFLGADDQGGSGISGIRCFFGDSTTPWLSSNDQPFVETAQLADGDYRLRCEATDNENNTSPALSLNFKVANGQIVTTPPQRTYLPLVAR
ncbi:MAG: N-acetylmuramoyl-L-alanine amidase [Chloroflexaceae bacterium]|jgi:hypothetical protein|nr:N-acetylmuramoyl-L-alanine amidase [Chloroflexaceae bacterium]